MGSGAHRAGSLRRWSDRAHHRPAGDVRGGAFALAASYRYFPKGTVHVVVVDPGVGSRRKAIAVHTATGVFVGPDNGVLSWALAKEKIRAIHALEDEAYFLQPVSRTFHTPCRAATRTTSAISS